MPKFEAYSMVIAAENKSAANGSNYLVSTFRSCINLYGEGYFSIKSWEGKGDINGLPKMNLPESTSLE